MTMHYRTPKDLVGLETVIVVTKRMVKLPSLSLKIGRIALSQNARVHTVTAPVPEYYRGDVVVEDAYFQQHDNGGMSHPEHFESIEDYKASEGIRNDIEMYLKMTPYKRMSYAGDPTKIDFCIVFRIKDGTLIVVRFPVVHHIFNRVISDLSGLGVTQGIYDNPDDIPESLGGGQRVLVLDKGAGIDPIISLLNRVMGLRAESIRRASFAKTRMISFYDTGGLLNQDDWRWIYAKGAYLVK